MQLFHMLLTERLYFVLPWAHVSIFRIQKQRHQHLCQQEVSQVVGAQLHLKAIGCLPIWAGHDAGIVDEDVNLVLIVQEMLCTLPHRVQGRKVKLHHINLPACLLSQDLCLTLAPGHVPAQHDDASASQAQCSGSLQANALVASW